MAETSALNSNMLAAEEDLIENDGVKSEDNDVPIKLESQECLVCSSRSRECFDIYIQHTLASGVSVHHYISKYAHNTVAFSDSCLKFICRSCYDLINILEQAELEYVKLKETFEAIISKNPLFDAPNPEPLDNADVTDIKNEVIKVSAGEDSEDEPLSRTKRTRNIKSAKKKRKSTAKHKQKNENESWACEECDAKGETGGVLTLTAHKLAEHTYLTSTAIKTEDGSQSPYNNGVDDSIDIEIDNEIDNFVDDDDDSNFNPDEFIDRSVRHKNIKRKVKRKNVPIKTPKVMHSCDQCDARYSSMVRLENHKRKHDGSKPPYICEVCGAHYKHKKACDIHIALHKGISDWKCEECNKLFPSRNALQRHNNIHTGKLNYQCDLCGKSFIHTSSFKMHKLTHTGVKPHACDVCGLALMTRSHLKRHKRIHSGEKRHECPACGKRFSERYNLIAHQKSHDSAQLAPTEPRRRLFRCHFCSDRFERRYMLERHMAVIHGRALERPPPTPRNTMSKLLKQRAQKPTSNDSPVIEPSEPKDEHSSESRTPTTSIAPSKLLAQLAATSTSIIATGSWSVPYAGDFARPEFPH